MLHSGGWGIGDKVSQLVCKMADTDSSQTLNIKSPNLQYNFISILIFGDGPFGASTCLLKICICSAPVFTKILSLDLRRRLKKGILNSILTC